MAGVETENDQLPPSQRGLLRANNWGSPLIWTLFGLLAFLDVVAVANLLLGGKASELKGVLMFSVFALFLGRVAALGLKVNDWGILVRSMFWTSRWRWDEIERFDLQGTVYTPSLRVTLKDGRERGVVGLAARTTGEQERAEKISVELNRRLEIEHSRVAE